ncbi:hypothetical protein [Spirochaeta dissipatitropha]
MFTVIRSILICLLLTLVPTVLVSAQNQRADADREKLYVRSVDPSDYPEGIWKHWDRNNDGMTDYVVLFNAAGSKVQEVYDYSHNGLFDDFYFYDDGELVSRELDTTHDGLIDVWVELDLGYLVTQIRRDTNADGVADFIRNYE